MAGEVYSIQIKLDVDSSELDSALTRAQGAERASGRGRYSGRSPRQAAAYRYRRAGLSEGQRDFMAGMTRFGRTNPWFASAISVGAAGKGLANVNRALSNLDRDFARNLFSIGGFRRNLGNFTNVIAQTGGALINAVPAMKALSTGLGAFLAIRGAGMFVGGGIMLAGKKLLMGQNINEAASNLMQFNAARMGLGSDYDEVYRRGSEMAATYGYSRSGIVQSANILSGLYVNGKPIGKNMALDLAGIAGKIAQSAGVDYNRVSLNLQQLLGQPTVNARDLRELIGQSPLVAKIAQGKMINETGNAGDVREYLKDKRKLLDVLYEFDRQLQAHPVMRFRGAVTLSKSDLWMRIAESGGVFFKDISDSIVNFNKMLEGRIARYASMYKPGAVTSMLDDFTKTMGSIMDGIVAFVPKLVKAITWANENIWTLSLAVAGMATGNPFIAAAGLLAGIALDSSNAQKQKELEYYEQTLLPREKDHRLTSLATARAIELGAKVDSSKLVLPGFPVQLDHAGMSMIDSIKKAAPPMLLNKLESDVRSDKSWELTGPNANKYVIGQDTYIKPLPDGLKALRIAQPDNTEEYMNILRNTSSGNTSYTDLSTDHKNMLQDMAGTRRSLTINFNREIVSMGDTKISASDSADLAEKLRPIMEDVVTSGLHRALATATNY